MTVYSFSFTLFWRDSGQNGQLRAPYILNRQNFKKEIMNIKGTAENF